MEAYGYGGNGIYINPEDSSYGFSNIKITNCVLHDNGITGLFVTGNWETAKQLIRYSNSNVYVAHSVAYNNYGRSDFKTNWSGSGLLVAGTVNGLIEYCEAYENGLENGSTSAGPIGIWTDDSKFVTIQHCVSHHNKGGKGKKDGGGFDIDGGCFGCVIQYCESYENEGAGYGLFQWQTGNPWSYDTVRYNTSLNDARNPYYGSITLWGAGAAFKVTEAQVYGNKITLDQPGKALGFIGNNFSNVSIHDNEFCLDKSAIYAPFISDKVSVTNSVFKCDSAVIIVPPVDIDTVIIDQQGLFIYPNPVVDNIVNVKFSNMASGEYTIRLINYSGITVYSGNFLLNQSLFTKQINVSNQASGAYALQLFNSKKQIVKTLIIH